MKKKEIPHQEKIEWMAMWAVKNHCQLELKGECGFGRECVGILSEGHYPSYIWYDKDYNRIDKNGKVWTPKDAYHKHPCVSVLGIGKDAENQLYEWLQWFDKHNFKLEVSLKTKEEIAGVPQIVMMMQGYYNIRMVKQKNERKKK